jgi:hypothetical protein
MAAMTALVCIAFTSIWGYVFISPDMLGLDPTIDYAWFVPTVLWAAGGPSGHIGIMRLLTKLGCLCSSSEVQGV